MALDSKRHHDLDALRAFAMLLGIVIHGTMSFICVPAWGAQDVHQNTPLYGTLLYAIHGFRLPLFFLLSGFFTMMLWKKRGSWGLVKHRLKHIGLPLLVFTIAVWPALIPISYWGLATKMTRDASGHLPVNQEIWQAAAQGNFEALETHRDLSTNVDVRDGLGTTALSYAAMHDRTAVIDHLLDQGADIHAMNSQGMTALHFAALFGQVDAAQRLVSHGANFNIRNRRGQTPLGIAHTDLRVVLMIATQFTVPVDSATSQKRRSSVIALLQERTSARPVDSWSQMKARCYALAIEMPIFVHLWFLYYLLLILGLFLIAISLRRRLSLPIPNWMVATPTCFLWLIPLTFTFQYFMTQSFGPDTAAGIVPWPPKLAYYTTFFLYGALAHGRPVFDKPGRHWKSLLILAIPILMAGIASYRQGAYLYSSVLAVTYTWIMIFGMIGFFRENFSSPNRRIRYLSDASYWLYIAHIPLIMIPQIVVSGWDLPHALKLVIVCLSTFTILILSYAYLVRHTFLGTFLHGKKLQQP